MNIIIFCDLLSERREVIFINCMCEDDEAQFP